MMRGITALFLSILAAVLPVSGQDIPDPLEGLAGLIGVDATFDYVIVGGGTAGLALANRLSANSSITVAVIEAGAFYQITNPVFATTPVGDVVFAGADPADSNPLVDWNFVTEPQAGAAGRRIHYARGKCLGGSSARNFIIYQRGTVQSYQQWADRLGDDSYTWDNLQPYFRRSAQFMPPSNTRFPNASAEYNAAAFAADGGPLQASYANYAQPFSTWLEPALHELGIPQTQDFNSGTLMGARYCSSTIRPDSQTRDSSQTSFLRDAFSRTNLKVYINTLAKRIIFDSSKRATGVVAESRPLLGLVQYSLRARREVIVSAGAFQSPQLLMVSGVGPSAELSRLNIPIVADRPGVGQTMEDHVFFGPSWRVNVETVTRIAIDILYTLAQLAGPYTLTKTGPLTSPVSDFLAWERLPRSLLPSDGLAADILNNTFPPDWPEVEYVTAPGYAGLRRRFFQLAPRPARRWVPVCDHPGGTRRPAVSGEHLPALGRHQRPAPHQPQLADGSDGRRCRAGVV